MSERAAAAYRPEQLAGFAAASFKTAGLDRGKARMVGNVLPEGPGVGHLAHAMFRPEPCG